MSAKKAVGRPRDESAHRRIIDATLALLNDEGMTGLSIEGIAARAGVSKATIYRRWDSKEDLLVDAVAAVVDFSLAVSETGVVRADLIAAVHGMRSFVTDTRAGEVFPWLVGEIANGTKIGKKYASVVVIPRRRMIGELITRAVERGELRSGIDVSTAVDSLIGPVIIRRMAGTLADTPEDWPDTLVDLVMSEWKA